MGVPRKVSKLGAYKTDMERAFAIHDALMSGVQGKNWQAEMAEGYEFQEPDKIIHRIYHSDGYCVEVHAERQCDVKAGDKPKDYDEEMLDDGWAYWIDTPDFEGFKDAYLHQVESWLENQRTP